MENVEWMRQWTKLSQKITRLRAVPIAKKLLAYKVFLRPLLISSWYEGCDEQIKELELNVLRRIFDVHDSEEVYRLYTDLDITSFLKVQGLRFKRLNLTSKPLRTVIHKVAKKSDNISYYTRNNDVGRVRRRQTRRSSRRHDSDSDPDSITRIFSETEQEEVPENASKVDFEESEEPARRGSRKSQRLADKNKKNRSCDAV